MKKVLLITHAFPPKTNIGAQRFYRLAKYFPRYGWEPIILTTKYPGKRPVGIRIIETDYKDISMMVKSKIGFDHEKTVHDQLGILVSKNYNYSTWKSKVIKLLKEIIIFPEKEKGWYKYAVKTASEFLANEKVNVIVSTSNPVTSHLIARKLKDTFKIPWIADFRDPWSQNPYSKKYPLTKYFDRRLELKTISETDAIVTVSDRWIQLFSKLHKDNKMFYISNGYDEDDYAPSSARLTDKFTVTYTGQLYNGKRDPSVLFDVLSKLILEKKINRELIDIRFFGPKEEWLDDEIDKYDLRGVVNIYGQLSREEVQEKQRESQVLLLLLWNNKNEEGFYPGKLYEYFGATRPIMAYGWQGSVVYELLAKTGAGKFAYDNNMLRDIFLFYYNEFVNSGQVKYQCNSYIEEFTYSSVTEKYAVILNELISQ